MPTGAPSMQRQAVPVRHRPNITEMTAGQIADLRAAFAALKKIGDDRGYEHVAGWHGLPLPVGDEGHCDVPSHPKDPFDDRPLHPLTPQTKTVDIGGALKHAARSEHLRVTVLAIVPDEDGTGLADVLQFGAMRLVTYA